MSKSKVCFRIEEITEFRFYNQSIGIIEKNKDFFMKIKVEWFYPPQSVKIKFVELKVKLNLSIGGKRPDGYFNRDDFKSRFFWIEEKDEDFVFENDTLKVSKGGMGLIIVKEVVFPSESPIFKIVNVERGITERSLLITIEEKEIITGLKLKFINLVSNEVLWKSNSWAPSGADYTSFASQISREKIKLNNWNEIDMKRFLGKRGESFELTVWGATNIEIVRTEEPEGSKPEQPEPDEIPPNSPPPPVAPTATEIATAKQNAQTALNSGNQAQLTTAKTALENLKQRLENAGASATEISDLINQIQTKIQTLMGDEAYRQIVLTEIANKLTENGLTENDLDTVSKTKLRNLKAKRTSGSQINEDAKAIKNQADQIMVEKKVISLTSRVGQVIKNGQRQAKENLRNEITALLNDSRYREKKLQLQALIQELENSLKDQSPSSNHNSSSFPWGYVIPIALIVVALMVGVGVIISKRKKKKKIK